MRLTHLVLGAIAAATVPLVTAGASGVGPEYDRNRAPDTATLVRTVQDATRGFQDARDVPDGYAPVLGCVSGPEMGAMGVHYVNGALVGDGALDAAHPEALIYEPRNGRSRLVAVEFIVLADAWHATHDENDPPALEGQLFHYVGSPNRFGLPAFYELHVWAWRDNPNGTFADWNPRVSCDGV